ncbi:Hcp family type VI secretion system effector [Cellulomonas biazotea]|jgi:type VI secretion system secreted protein Hcp|uniref:Type VI secretion protein n=1 Tax=Cellulomonas biazotea TaxID=1709 RepID=A0A402DQB4_9CELL|nr:type VI secretion system tube protein Hcp [Cellulomonas biazotea]GCE76314.1 type VI secretion protein [Cellulomonas biazotea]
MSTRTYLRLATIEGGSVDRHHEGWIDVRSFSWSESVPVSGHAGVGGATGRVTTSPLVVTAEASVASPRLFLACARSARLDVAELEVVRAGEDGGRPFLRWRLEGVAVTGYAVTGEDFLPVDTLTLTFRSLRFDVQEQQPDGSPGQTVSAEFDFFRLLDE